MRHSPVIMVATGHRRLAAALGGRLHALHGVAVVTLEHLEEAEGPGVVVATAGICSAEACRRLSERRLQVIILAALPRVTERDAYKAAGAADYLAMATNLGPLQDAIAQALDHGSLLDRGEHL